VGDACGRGSGVGVSPKKKKKTKPLVLGYVGMLGMAHRHPPHRTSECKWICGGLFLVVFGDWFDLS